MISDIGKANLTISMDEDGWKVVDADSREEVTRIEFVENEKVELSLVILPADGSTEAAETADDAEQRKEIIENLFTFIPPEEKDDDAQSKQTASGIGENTEGAEEVYQNFLEKTAIIATDESWDYVLNTLYGKLQRASWLMKDTYVESVKGATEEQWENMTAYEIFVYMHTYIDFACMVGGSGRDLKEYFSKDDDDGIDKYMKYRVGEKLFTGTNADEVLDAIREVAEWQAAFIRQYNYPYNFITGKSYAEETSFDPGSESTIENSEESVDIEDLGLTAEEKKEIEEAFAEDDPKDDSAQLLKYGLPILLLVVAGLAAFLVVYSRRGKK